MADAVILIGGKVIRATDVTDIEYTLDGFALSFSLNGRKYVNSSKFHFNEDTAIMENSNEDGYYPEDEFLKFFNKEKITAGGLGRLKLNLNDLSAAKEGDTIKIKKLILNPPDYEFCKVQSYAWTYDLTNSGYNRVDRTISVPHANTGSTENKIVGNNAAAFYHKYYVRISTLPLNDPPVERNGMALLLAKIALRIDAINEGLYSPLFSDSDSISYVEFQNDYWINNVLTANFSIESAHKFYKSISRFHFNVYHKQYTIIQSKTEDKLYWLAYTLSAEALSIVPVDEKISILEKISNRLILGATIDLLPKEFINEEEYAIRIVKSISQIQADSFLAGIMGQTFEGGNKLTLMEILYNKIDNKGLGKENLKEFIHTLFEVWKLSSFNPYNSDGSVKDNLINPSKYSNNPILINYSASKGLIFNYTNYNFEFTGTNISVTEDIWVAPMGIEPHRDIRQVGNYDIFQTVTIQATAQNTNSIGFTAVNVNGEVNAAMPIFYLKYIDDEKEIENLITLVEITFDVIITFTGLGNIGKLRHLRHLSRLGRLALGLEATANAADPIILYELGQGVYGVIQTTGSLISMWLNYVTQYETTYCNPDIVTYDEALCDWYKKFDRFIFLLQIWSTAREIGVSKALNNSARDLLSGPIPNANSFHSDGLIILRKFAGQLDEIKEIFRVRLIQLFPDQAQNIIWLRLTEMEPDALLSAIKREEFIWTFEKSSEDILRELNADNGELITYWNDIKEIEDYKMHRSRITFLKAHKFIQNDVDLLKHVHEGTINTKVLPDKNTPLIISGLHNQEGLVNQLNSPPAGSWSYVNIDEVKSTKSYPYYKTAEIQRDCSDVKITKSGSPDEQWINNFYKNDPDPRKKYFKKKKDKTGLWPASYNTQRINEEMALAYEKKGANLAKKLNEEKYISRASDGHVIYLWKINGKWSIFPKTF